MGPSTISRKLGRMRMERLETIPLPPHLISYEGVRLQLHDLPLIDAILLSHENHVDELDPEGRRLLDG
ncbi:hypothetical protein IFM47457_02794 [Aspergillus lentulus]|nr:hypothetical protein IFM47457_02794 [Aspergillus lentulus]